MTRAGASFAALAVFLCAVTPADASLTRRMKFRAEQDAKRDTGPAIPPGQLHIIVSIKSQRVAVYSDGILAAKSNVSTGVPEHPTPTGVFSIIQKNRHHRSNIYSGAPMPFMQRITWSGIALHQGVLPGRPASHGCIRLSADFAQRMWKRTKLGARVIVARDEVAPYAFTHPKLFAPKALTAELDMSPVKTAKAETTASDAPEPATDNLPVPDYPPIADVTADIRKSIHEENPDAKKRPVPTGPVSVFISRKERKLYVRQGMIPLFETLVTIADDTKPFGTHVFTATEPTEKGMKWTAVSLPVDAPKVKVEKKAKPEIVVDRYGRRFVRSAKAAAPPAPPYQPVTPDAASVLERIDIPKDAIARIEALMGPGASLIIADAGLGYETGEGTDFIVITR